MSNITTTFLFILACYGIVVAKPTIIRNTVKQEVKNVDNRGLVEKENNIIHNIFKYIFHIAENAFQTILLALNKILYRTVKMEKKTMYERIV